MNIFFLSENIRKSVQSYCDQHIVKIPIEITQMLCTAHHQTSLYSHTQELPDFFYKEAYVNHPMSIWVRSSLSNYRYSTLYLFNILEEYSYRYGKIHSGVKLGAWLYANEPEFEKELFSLPPQCMPKRCQLLYDNHPENMLTVVEAYRNCYRDKNENSFRMRYTRREKPDWL